MAAIDLNADLGETVDGVPTADDEAMFAVISSANIACGGHAGGGAALTEAVDRARRHRVAVGAHPSYPDRVGFGRVRIDIDDDDLALTLDQQLRALERAGASIRYVKPHGALYHAVTTDAGQARVVAHVVAAASERAGRALPILGLAGEILAAAEDVGLPFVGEAFLDRGYLPTGALVPRGQPGALLDSPEVVAARAVRLARHGEVEAVDGSVVRTRAVSMCLHGDSPSAVAMARAVRSALDDAAIDVRAPW
ncbi:5-oxoprolinase subunit PxpA [Microbacterium koreense]|uniref:5-oxoprolinase subunit PxpA n=1 Tax=Microbacterium koreense TaxID=323761 RepID=A0ABW2ZM74_9MICO